MMDIVYMEERDKQVEAFNKYIGKEENLELFLKIFPIVATTCISARKLGEPKPVFDMVIMDENRRDHAICEPTGIYQPNA